MHPLIACIAIGVAALLILSVPTLIVASITLSRTGSMNGEMTQMIQELAVLNEALAPISDAWRTPLRATLVAASQMAVDASGTDHAPGGGGSQLGPGRASRAMAITHIAMVDVVAAVSGEFRAYTDVVAPAVADSDTAMRAGIVRAVHDTLVALYPAQTAAIDEASRRLAAAIADSPSKVAGTTLGATAARAILERRADDGAAHDEPPASQFESQLPGRWRRDPITQSPTAVGGLWGTLVQPFVLESASQFPCRAAPLLSSTEYALEYAEVIALGGDNATTPTVRADWQTFEGTFWAYDGRPSLCAPPRLYNQITYAAADAERLEAIPLARLLGVLNVALADAGIAIWRSKYELLRARPVTGVRAGAADGNDATTGYPQWRPLGAPTSNGNGPNFTPPFPSLPSGHAGFGEVLAETLRTLLGRDDVAFDFVSDEYNGATRDNSGTARARRPVHFSSFSEIAERNGDSRIYLGIHWKTDKTYAIEQGRKVAGYVVPRIYQPIE